MPGRYVLPSRKPREQFRIALNDNGFSVHEGPTHRWSLRWAAVLWIAAYKRDLYTADLICLELVTESGEVGTPCRVREVDEELEGFSALVERVKEVFPTSKQQWEPAIWPPAFKAKYTIIYSKAPGVLLVAADSLEVRAMVGLTKLDLELRRPGFMSLGVAPSLVALHGPGVEYARVAVDRGFERIPVGALVSIGYVGALDPALEVGQIFLARQITREGSPPKHVELPEFPKAGGIAEGTLLTIDRVAQTREEKRALRQSGADAVDMEAYAVAEEAESRGVPFYCVRVVSDRADADFPVDFNRARRTDGTFAGWRVLLQAGLNPNRWKRLRQLQRDADLASQRLADFLRTCRFVPSPR